MSNLWAPRLGYVYDLTGNGKTVVKANYGFYWHNPGVVISQNANDNIASKSATTPGTTRRRARAASTATSGGSRAKKSATPTAQALSRHHQAGAGHQGAVLARGQRLGRTSAQPDDGRPGRLRLQDAGRSDHDQLSARSRTERLHGAVRVPGPRLERRPRHGCRRLDGDGRRSVRSDPRTADGAGGATSRRPST